MEMRPSVAMAHGGTTPPNGAAFDAMFFKNYGTNPFVDTDDDPLSTFAVDVDSASYTVTRSYLLRGVLPPREAVRTEEFVNFFDYDYGSPEAGAFAIHLEGAPSKFGPNRQLLRIGLQAREIQPEERRNAVLTFVIDVSGSMARENRLGLVKRSLRMLVERLRPSDRVGIVVYGSRARVVLRHKSIREKRLILTALEYLAPGGSTYAEEGLRQGYALAAAEYRKGCINRVILCSDGVANVGRTGAEDILKIIKGHAEKGITLSSIGFGMGNYNDILMEQLGDKGNGHYAYVDTPAEARRIFGENLTGTLQVVARDVKVQVDFNPEVVRSYRLLGYENRAVRDDRFRDDREDGGDVGAGHSVTALYELKLWKAKQGRLAEVHIRYADPDSGMVREIQKEIRASDLRGSFSAASSAFMLAALVAEFAEILRESYWARDGELDPVLALAHGLPDRLRKRTDVVELIDLIAKAREMKALESPEKEEKATRKVERGDDGGKSDKKDGKKQDSPPRRPRSLVKAD
jgi:Ca-activated chloride channel family protein